MVDLSGQSPYQGRLIHPVIRVFTLIVFALLVSRADLLHMLLACLLIVGFYVRLGVASRRAAMTMLYRMRWFFLSLLLVYGWLTPDPLSGQLSYWTWPSTSGLQAGGQQVFGLMLIMLAVNLLLVFSRREELLQAIYWLARPLTVLGLSRSRLALRLVLVLDWVASIREQAGQTLLEQGAWSHRRWAAIADVATVVFRKTLERADAMVEEDIVFQPLQAPPWYQWGVPLITVPGLFLLPL